VNNICPEMSCTGCCACLNICPAKAISIAENDFGFIVAKIDGNICTDCKLCRKICPQIAKSKLFEPKVVYAAWAKNKEEHLSSSSGGAASIFYRNIIERFGGACVGAAFDEGLILRHQVAEDMDGIYKFKGSKYVQSFIGDVFSKVKEYIKNKKYVLFIGTPCQVDGLKNFLGSHSEYLFTIDLICHGVPPIAYLQQHFKKYLKRDPKIVVSFRANNNFRMNLQFYNGEKIVKKNDIYLHAFLEGLIYRDSCYSCRYAQKNRCGDITIGDFWGLSNDIASLKEAQDGCSVILINTEKGNELFNACKEDFVFFERTLEEARKGNRQLNSPTILPKNRELFLKNYKKGFSFACNMALFPKFHLRKVYNFLPCKIKEILNKLKLLGTKIYNK